jgi:hypothetical protein
LTDRKDPTRKYISEPILKPKKGAPYEIQNGHDLWVPGVIYSCGAILNEWKPNYEKRGYDLTIDVYYSGSDTAVLWATVEVFVKKKEDEAMREALREKTKKISRRLKAVKPDKDDGEDVDLEDQSQSDGVSRRPDDEEAIEPTVAAARLTEPVIAQEGPVIEIGAGEQGTGHDAYDEKFPLKNITDANELADNLVELAISKVLSRDAESGGKEGPKKLVLAFDKNIMSKRALAVFKSLERLKKDPKYQVLLQNLEIVIERSEREKEDDKLLSEELQKYAGKDDTVVFVFAEEKANKILNEFEPFKNINTSYIKIEGKMQIDHYYPLAEIVAMTLGYYLKEGCINGFTNEELEKINLKPNPEVKKNGVLIFTILPKMGRYDYSDRHDRYVLIKGFLRAA